MIRMYGAANSKTSGSRRPNRSMLRSGPRRSIRGCLRRWRRSSKRGRSAGEADHNSGRTDSDSCAMGRTTRSEDVANGAPKRVIAHLAARLCRRAGVFCSGDHRPAVSSASHRSRNGLAAKRRVRHGRGGLAAVGRWGKRGCVRSGKVIGTSTSATSARGARRFGYTGLYSRHENGHFGARRDLRACLAACW